MEKFSCGHEINLVVEEKQKELLKKFPCPKCKANELRETLRKQI